MGTMPGTIYNQKDILLLPFPYSNLKTTKKRPALVLSSDTFNSSGPDIICCLITTNPKQNSFTVPISEQDVEEGKLFFASTVRPYRLFTIEKSIVNRKLCRLGTEKFDMVVGKLTLFVSSP